MVSSPHVIQNMPSHLLFLLGGYKFTSVHRSHPLIDEINVSCTIWALSQQGMCSPRAVAANIPIRIISFISACEQQSGFGLCEVEL